MPPVAFARDDILDRVDIEYFDVDSAGLEYANMESDWYEWSAAQDWGECVCSDDTHTMDAVVRFDTALPYPRHPQRVDDASENYFLLLEGNPSDYDLRERFVRLFGWHSTENILNYYSLIFDMPSEQVDARILSVLTVAPLPYVFFDLEAGDVPPPPTMFCVVLPDPYVSFEPDLLIDDVYDDAPLYFVLGDWVEESGFFVEEHLLINDLAVFMDNLILDCLQSLPTPPPYMRPVEELEAHEYEAHHIDGYAIPLSPQYDVYVWHYARIAVASMSNNSVTLDLVFNSNDASLNHFRKRDFTIPGGQYGGTWVDIAGQFHFNRPPIQTGRRTVHGLVPGATYVFEVYTWSWARSAWMSYELRVTLPGQRQNAPHLSVTNRTATSFTVNFVFPVDGNWGNRITHNGRDITGEGWHARNNLNGVRSITINNLQPNVNNFIDFHVYDRHNERWMVNTHHYIPLPQSNVRILESRSVTTTSIAIRVVFPEEGHRDNRLMRRSSEGAWTDARYNTGSITRSGVYTFAGLEPGKTYYFGMYYFNPRYRVTRWEYLRPNPRTLHCNVYFQRFQRRDLVFYLRREDVARGSYFYINRWMDRMQQAHDDLYHLTGNRPWQGQPMVMRSTRYLNHNGLSGNPIRINHNAVPNLIARAETCWSFLVMHEMSHNFDKRTGPGGGGWGWANWGFGGLPVGGGRNVSTREHFANFKVAYTMSRRNATTHDLGGRIITGLAGYRNYFAESYRQVFVYRNWDRRYPTPFSENALTYSFLRIQQQIGWEPFRQTFRYFNRMAVNLDDPYGIATLNLFLTRLRDYSGRDVIGMWRYHERFYYGLIFGRCPWSIRYVN